MLSNLSEFTLMSGDPVLVCNNLAKVQIHIPSLRECYTTIYDYNFFIGSLSIDLNEINKKAPVKFVNRLEYFKYFLFSKEEDFKTKSLQYFFDLCFPGTKENVGDWLLINDNALDYQIFDVCCECIKVGCGVSSLRDFKRVMEDVTVEKTPEELEWERKEREYEQKIQKAKAKQGGSLDLEKMIYSILHDFPMSLEELINKNFFVVQRMYVQTMKIDAYNVNIIAEGNGLVKKEHKHQHWTNIK